MGYDVAILASLKAPKGEIRKWRASVVDASAHHDWPEVLSSFEEQPLGPGAPARVDGLLDKLPSLATEFPAKVEIDDTSVRIVAVLPDQPFTLFGAWIASALRALADHGGEGRLDFIGFLTSPLALSLRIAPDGSEWRTPDEAEVGKIERTPQFVWIEKASGRNRVPLPVFKWPKAAAAKAAGAGEAAAGAGKTGAPAALFDMLVSGEVRFGKKGDLRKWAAARVGPEALTGSPAPLVRDFPARSPLDLSTDIEASSDPWFGSLRLDPPELRARVKGGFPSAQAGSWAAPLAAVFGAAAQHGGEGRLFLVSPTDAPPRGFIVEVKPGASTVREAGPEDWQAGAADPLHREATAHFGPNLKKA